MLKSAALSRWLRACSFFSRVRADRAHGAWGHRAARALFEQDLLSESKRCALGAVACAVMALALFLGAQRPIDSHPSTLDSALLAPPSFAPPVAPLAPASFKILLADGPAVFDNDDPSLGDLREAKPFLADLHDADPICIILLGGSLFFGLTAAHLCLQRALGSLRPWRIDTLAAKRALAESRWHQAHTAWLREARAARRIAFALGATRGRSSPKATIKTPWTHGALALALGLWRKATGQSHDS